MVLFALQSLLFLIAFATLLKATVSFVMSVLRIKKLGSLWADINSIFLMTSQKPVQKFQV